MWEPACALRLSDHHQAALTDLVRGRNTPQQMALRPRIILHCAEGLANHAIAKKLNVNRKTVILWRTRFAAEGMAGLDDESPPGREPEVPPELGGRGVPTALPHKTPP